MLNEAAWGAASVPRPLRAFFLRVKDRKGANVAAVATARKIANLIWHLLTKDEPCIREWGQKCRCLANPVRQSGTVEIKSIAFEDLALAIQMR